MSAFIKENRVSGTYLSLGRGSGYDEHYRKRIDFLWFVLNSSECFDIRIVMKKSVLASAILLFSILAGCAEHHVDTFQEWCELISEEKPFTKDAPFWIVKTSVSIDEEKIRNDFTFFINRTLLKKVKNQVPRMAWRKDSELHLVNLAGLLDIKPEIMIEKWRQGIEMALENKQTDSTNICLYVTVIRLFESLHIHTRKADQIGIELADDVTIISTTRSGSGTLSY
jgi:hypothetical protein